MIKNLKDKVFLAVLVVLGSLLLGQLSVNIFAHGGDDAQIHSCVKSDSGNVRIVGADEACKENEEALDWNIQGEQGPSGPIVCSTCKARDLLIRLNQTDLLDSNFDLAILNSINVEGENLSGSSFVNAVLTSANGIEANFTGSNFTGANLTDVNFQDATMSAVNLSNTDLTHTFFQGVDLSTANLSGASWDATVCPDGTSSDEFTECIGHLTP